MLQFQMSALQVWLMTFKGMETEDSLVGLDGDVFDIEHPASTVAASCVVMPQLL